MISSARSSVFRGRDKGKCALYIVLNSILSFRHTVLSTGWPSVPCWMRSRSKYLLLLVLRVSRPSFPRSSFWATLMGLASLRCEVKPLFFVFLRCGGRITAEPRILDTIPVCLKELHGIWRMSAKHMARNVSSSVRKGWVRKAVQSSVSNSQLYSWINCRT